MSPGQVPPLAIVPCYAFQYGTSRDPRWSGHGHAVWAIREGAPLTPIGARQKKNGEVVTERFGVESPEQGPTQLQGFIDSARSESTGSVVVLDAMVSLGERNTDALVMTLTSYGAPDFSFKVIVPYRPFAQGFAVQRPRVIEAEGASEAQVRELSDLFWKGVQSNTKGATTWNQHLVE